MHTSISQRVSRLVFLLSLILVSANWAQTVRAAEIELKVAAEPSTDGIFPVFVLVDSLGEPTVGTDLLISYDATRVAFEDLEFGDLYPQQHQVQHTASTQQLRFSGTHEYQSYESVSGLLATLFFRTLSSDQRIVAGEDSAVSVEWSDGATNDTNVVSTAGSDLLTRKPAPLSVDASILDGEVQGVLTEQQLNNLAAGGVVAEASQAKRSLMHPRSLGGIALLAGSLAGLMWFMFFRKKKKDTAEDTNTAG